MGSQSYCLLPNVINNNKFMTEDRFYSRAAQMGTLGIKITNDNYKIINDNYEIIINKRSSSSLVDDARVTKQRRLA